MRVGAAKILSPRRLDLGPGGASKHYLFVAAALLSGVNPLFSRGSD
jgi:hypothetical protein